MGEVKTRVGHRECLLSDSERIAVQRKTVQEHLVGETSNDWETVNNTFLQTDEAYYEVVPGGAHMQGCDQVRDFYKTLAAALPDLQLDVTHEYDVPGCSIREMTASGTHSAEFLGVAPARKWISFEVCALYIFDHRQPDKLLAERAYWDNDGLLKQMRGEPTQILGMAKQFRR